MPSAFDITLPLADHEIRDLDRRVAELLLEDARLYLDAVVPVLEGPLETPPLFHGWEGLRAAARERARRLTYIWHISEAVVPLGGLSEHTRGLLFLLQATYEELKSVKSRDDLCSRHVLSPTVVRVAVGL